MEDDARLSVSAIHGEVADVPEGAVGGAPSSAAAAGDHHHAAIADAPARGGGEDASIAMETDSGHQRAASGGGDHTTESDDAVPDGAFACRLGMPLIVPDDLGRALSEQQADLEATMAAEATASGRSTRSSSCRRRRRRRARRAPTPPSSPSSLSSSSSSASGAVPVDLFASGATGSSSSGGPASAAEIIGLAGLAPAGPRWRVAHGDIGGGGAGAIAAGVEGGTGGPGGMAVDAGQRRALPSAARLSGTAKAIAKYSDSMAAALGAALLDGGGAAAAVDNSSASFYRVNAVAGGAAVVFTEGEKGHVAWMRRVVSGTIFLCSCGGRRGAESTEMRAFAGASSTCVHGYALRDAAAALVSVAAVQSVEELLDRYPVLDAARTTPVDVLDVHYGTKTPKKMGVFAVLESHQWAAVTIRRRMAKGKAKKRMGLRAACSHLACANHWTCSHAIAVNDWCRQARAAVAVADGVGRRFHIQDADVHLSTFVWRTGGGPAPAGRSADDARYSDETRWRSVRNMLPCEGEVADCLVFDELADVGRGGPPPVFQQTLREAQCFKCKAPYQSSSVSTTGAMLHTLRGRVSVQLEEWLCSCGTLVPYGGAHDSLFASSKKTVFTRTFLDVMAQMVFTGHSTLSSAAGVFSFLLEVTKSLPGGRQSLSRQLLITAVHRYTRTLLVPAALFRCLACYKTEQRPYPVVVSDGEAISVQRNQSEPLERVEADVTVTKIDADVGSCLTIASLRGAIRKRAKAKSDETVRLTKRESQMMTAFGSASVADPTPHDADNVVTRPANVLWASSYIFFSFFTVQPAIVGAPSAPTDANADPPPPPNANDEQGGHADEPLDGDLRQAAGGYDAAVGGTLGQHECGLVDGAVGSTGGRRVERERWDVVRHFVRNFLAEPVLGAFAGVHRGSIKRLAVMLVTMAPMAEWRPCIMAVESVLTVWPFLRLVAEGDDVDPLLMRAVGELLLFTCGVDAYWESVWRTGASDAALQFEEQWKTTSVEHYKEWERSNGDGVAAPEHYLSSTSWSRGRVAAQAIEARSGHVWPDLEPVRPFMRDSKSDAVNARRAERVRNDAAALERELARQLGADECRHNFITSEVFMPGIENFLCPCGLLIGYDFLDKAESPAHVLASLVQRMPLLPKVIYFDTACQLSRNAFRRVPWLMNMSNTAASVDRHHNQGDQHSCSDSFNADKYPGRSVHHKTSCAESRHSLNKAFKTHLAHLRQDHFIVQMRLLAAVINLRVLMRKKMGRETNHRLLCKFFHEHVVSHCERRHCTCPKWLQDPHDDVHVGLIAPVMEHPVFGAGAGGEDSGGAALGGGGDGGGGDGGEGALAGGAHGVLRGESGYGGVEDTGSDCDSACEGDFSDGTVDSYEAEGSGSGSVGGSVPAWDDDANVRDDMSVCD